MKTTLIFIIVIFSQSVNGQVVNIPDAQFKACLLSDSLINTNMDSEIQVSEANAFTGYMECFSSGISNVTGLEYFTSVTGVTFWNNSISTIDVSSNTELISLNCSLNQLSSLDVSSNPDLEYLFCSSNNLTSLNIDGCTELIALHCDENHLSSIMIDDKLNLWAFRCENNLFTAFDFSNHPELRTIHCRDNNLTYLNVANGLNIIMLNLHFSADGNPNLICIEVDDENYSAANWLDVDPQTSYSTDCNALGTADIEIQISASLYPNPALDYIFISNPCSFQLFNSLGQLIDEGSKTMQIDLRDVESGIYTVVTSDENGYVETHQISKK